VWDEQVDGWVDGLEGHLHLELQGFIQDFFLGGEGTFVCGKVDQLRPLATFGSFC